MGKTKKTIDEIKARQSSSIEIMKLMASGLGFDQFTGFGKGVKWDEYSDGNILTERCDFTQEDVGFLHMVVSRHESTGRIKDLYSSVHYFR